MACTPDLEIWLAERLGRLGFADPQAIAAHLRADHERPETPYHNWSHIEHGLCLLRDYEKLIPHFSAVLIAWLNHDRNYDAKRSDNEVRSAALAREMGAEIGDAAFVELVAELVMDTCHKVPPAGENGRWMVSVDLAILGEAQERYIDYARNVQREYAHVPASHYRAGRRAVLEGFLKRDRIYMVEELSSRFEAAARRNITAELEAF